MFVIHYSCITVLKIIIALVIICIRNIYMKILTSLFIEKLNLSFFLILELNFKAVS